MSTESILKQVHQVCTGFPKIRCSDKRERHHKSSKKCFAYSYVNGRTVFVTFRVSIFDLFKAVFQLGGRSFNWCFRKGIWLTITVDEQTDWYQLRAWVATSYKLVIGRQPTLEDKHSFQSKLA